MRGKTYGEPCGSVSLGWIGVLDGRAIGRVCELGDYSAARRRDHLRARLDDGCEAAVSYRGVNVAVG
jgi:hypothetical protein